MAKKVVPWFQSPQVLISVAVGLTSLFGFIYVQVAADVGQKRDIQEHEEELEKLSEALTEQDREIE